MGVSLYVTGLSDIAVQRVVDKFSQDNGCSKLAELKPRWVNGGTNDIACDEELEHEGKAPSKHPANRAILLVCAEKHDRTR